MTVNNLNRINKKSSLKVNAVMNAILKVSQVIFPVITFPYISRVLLAEGTGKVSFATSIINYFLMFSKLGIPTYGLRECAKVRDDKNKLSKLVQELFTINLITTIISYLVLVILVFCIPKLTNEKTLIFLISILIFTNCIGMEWLYQGLEMYSYIAVRSLIFKAIGVIAMFLLVRSADDYIIYGGITIFASAASDILNAINLHKFARFKRHIVLNLKKHLKSIVIFFAMACATTVYTYLDNVMLGLMTNNMEVGYYSAAVKIKVVLVNVVTSLGVVLLPRSTNYLEYGRKDEFLRITKKAMNIVVIFAAPLTVYFILYAREGILFLSGSGFVNSIIPMMVIMPTVLFIGMSNITGIQILLTIGKEKIVLYSEIAGAIIDFVVNAILIPKYLSTGAAIGTLIAEILVWSIQYLYVRKKVTGIYKNIRFGLIGGAICIASILSLTVRLLQIGNFLTLLLSAIIFFGVYLIILLLGKENVTIEIFNQALRKLKIGNRSIK